MYTCVAKPGGYIHTRVIVLMKITASCPNGFLGRPSEAEPWSSVARETEKRINLWSNENGGVFFLL